MTVRMDPGWQTRVADPSGLPGTNSRWDKQFTTNKDSFKTCPVRLHLMIASSRSTSGIAVSFYVCPTTASAQDR